MAVRNTSGLLEYAPGITQFNSRTRAMPPPSRSDRGYVGDCKVHAQARVSILLIEDLEGLLRRFSHHLIHPVSALPLPFAQSGPQPAK